MKKKRFVQTGIVLSLIILTWLIGKTAGSRTLTAFNSGVWELRDGYWYYEVDGSPLTGCWVDDGDYFVDEQGRMLENEWIAVKSDGSGYLHGYELDQEDLEKIDLEHLMYVGHDGKQIRNKIIYGSGFSFDENGVCDASGNMDFNSVPDYGFEGFRKYVMIYGKYKDYIY